MNTDPCRLVRGAAHAAGLDPEGELWAFRFACPIDTQHGRSVSCIEGVDGRAVLHCEHYCEPDQMAIALGLKARELAAPPEPSKVAGNDAVTVFETMSTMRARRPLWLLRPYLPLGKVVLLAGAPGHGKSQLMALFAALTTRGMMYPGDVTVPSGVLMISAEDDAADTIKPRLMAAGADLERVERMFVRRRWGNITAEGLITLPGNVDELHDRMSRKDIRLVVFDPVASFFAADYSTHSNQDVRAVLDPLKTLAETHAATIVLILHLNKQSEVREWASRIAESHGFQAAARSVMVLGPDPDDPEGSDGVHKIVSLSKSNLARKTDSSMRLEIVETSVTEDDGTEIEITRIDMRGRTQVSAEDLLMPSGERETRLEVAAWLEEFIGDGWAKVSDVKGAAKSDGLSWRTVERIRKSHGYQKIKQQGVKHGPWWLGGPRARARDLLGKGSLGSLGSLEPQDRQDNIASLGGLDKQGDQGDQGTPSQGVARDARAREDDLEEYYRYEQRKLGERDDDDLS